MSDALREPGRRVHLQVGVESDSDCAAGLVHAAFVAQARRTPDAPAVAAADGTLSFAELDARSARLAHALRGLGAGPERRVGLMVERGTGLLAGILGILRAGAAYVPLDPAQPPARLEQLAAECGLAAAVSQASLAGRVPLPAERVVRLDSDAAALAALPAEAPGVAMDPRCAAYVIHTSGSTGRPKGVTVAHASVLDLAAALEAEVYRGLGGPLRVSLNAPPVFDGSVKQWIQLLRGHALHVVPEAARAEPERLLAWLAAHEVNVLDCTPTLLRGLLAAGLGAPGTHAPRLVLSGGEALDPAAWAALRALPATRVCNLYGPTEFTVDATAGWVHDSAAPGIGRPLPGTGLRLLDAGLGPVPDGEPGEVCLAGERLARGYLGRPELTAERFVPDPGAERPGGRMYRTGDRARRGPDGWLEYLGRTDDQVKIRGVRIEPGEAAAVLREHPALRDAAVVARPDGPGGEARLVAYTVARAGAAPAAGELREWLRERLPAHLVPAAWVALAALPTTPGGKLDRAALPAPPAAAAPERPHVAPRTPTEQALAEVWAEVLGVERVGVHDGFWELGGDSVALVRLHARLEERLGCPLSLPDLFGVRTLAGLAARLDGEDTHEHDGGDSRERADARRARARMRRAVRSGADAGTNLEECEDEQRG
jgi:amino acid adenylation domain-containing protein